MKRKIISFGISLLFFQQVNAQSPRDAYRTAYKYDANGNITELMRYDKDGILIDHLQYVYQNTANGYKTNSNKLASVTDLVTNNGSTYKRDIKNQDPDNYTFDELGNVISDKQQEIKRIDWNWKNKIQSIERFENSTLPNVYFKYDGFGNMVAQSVVQKNGDIETTYYIKDMQGRVMSIYTQTDVDIKLKEQYIYGQQRVGVITKDMKQYELTDHLGNVRTVVSDNNEVMSATDYYPFGMVANSYSKVPYRYGYNGKEDIDEVAGMGNFVLFDERGYDPRIARWWSVDPWYPKYAGISPYEIVQNSPIIYKEIDGRGYEIAVEGNTITITFTVFVADETNKKLVERVNEAKKILESSNFKFTPNGSTKEYDIKFDIKVASKDGKPADAINVAKSNPTHNSIREDAKKTGGPTLLGENQRGVARNQTDMIVSSPSTNENSSQGIIDKGTVLHEMIHDMSNLNHLSGTVYSEYEKDFTPTITAEIIEGILDAAGSSQKFAICTPTDCDFFQNGTVTGQTLNFAPNFEEIKNAEANKANEMKQNAAKNIKTARKVATQGNSTKKTQSKK